MNNAPKYAVVKQCKRSPFTVQSAEEYEVRSDAREDCKRKNATAINYKYRVVTLKVGKIRRVDGSGGSRVVAPGTVYKDQP